MPGPARPIPMNPGIDAAGKPGADGATTSSQTLGMVAYGDERKVEQTTVWNSRLPPRLRSVLLQATKEKYPEEYEVAIKAYFKVLSAGEAAPAPRADRSRRSQCYGFGP